MAQESMTEQEVMARLGVSKADLDKLVEEGRLTAVEREGQRVFSEQQVSAIEAAAEKEEGLFDFSEDLETELMAKPGEGAAAKAEEPPPDGEMITEVLEIGEDEVEEEDLLGDIIEDVGAVEETGELIGEETVEAGLAEEVAVSGDETAEITQLGDEAFEGEELEEILAGEEAIEAGELEEGELEAAYEARLGALEEPVPSWVAVLLVVVLAVQIIGGLYVIGNAMLPKNSPTWLTGMNLFKK